MTENWTLARIEQMIKDGIEEGRTLDYKGAEALQKTDGKKNEISKDVSAFANSNGGVIIYGVREFDVPNKKHLPEKLDPIKRDEISKEWLEQIIQTKIQPKIEGVEIVPIEVSKEDNTAVYVVDIPRSNTAHQAYGHRYYKRYNFENVPMEDYEIRDVMNRGVHPNLELVFEIEKRQKGNAFPTGLPTREPMLSGHNTYLKVRIYNKGNVYAKYVNYIITINKNYLGDEEGKNLKVVERKSTGEEYVEYYGENTIRDVVDVTNSFRPKYGPSRFDPILPGMYSRPEEIRLANGLLFSFDDDLITWVIYADNAQPKHGQITIGDIKTVSTKYL